MQINAKFFVGSIFKKLMRQKAWKKRCIRLDKEQTFVLFFPFNSDLHPNNEVSLITLIVLVLVKNVDGNALTAETKEIKLVRLHHWYDSISNSV